MVEFYSMPWQSRLQELAQLFPRCNADTEKNSEFLLVDELVAFWMKLLIWPLVRSTL